MFYSGDKIVYGVAAHSVNIKVIYILADHVTIIYGYCSEPICLILGKCGYLIDKDKFK